MKQSSGLSRVYFWRTTNKTEIDFIVQQKGLTEAIEVKWSSNKRPKSFNTIELLYPGIKTKVVTRGEFLPDA